MKKTFFIFISFSLIFFKPQLSYADELNLSEQSSKPKGVTILNQKITIPSQIKTFEDTTPKEQAEQSRELFKQANKYFENRQLPTALENYKQAYRLWPHPRILFNMGVTLAMMSRPLDAANMFKKVLEYGPEPVTPLRYKEARDRYLELMGTLVILTVKCQQPDVITYVDGSKVGTCPFNKTLTLTSGRHLVTANKEEYITLNEDIYVPSGVVALKNIHLKKLALNVHYKTITRYSRIWPIVTAISSGILIGAGSYMTYKGRNDIDQIQNEIDQIVATQGNKPFEFDENRIDTATNYQKVGSGLIGAGTTGVLTSVFLYLFRQKKVLITGEETVEDKNTVTLEK